MRSEKKDDRFGVEIDIQKLPYLVNTEMLSVGIPSLGGVPCDKEFSPYPRRLVSWVIFTSILSSVRQSLWSLL